MLVPTSVLNIQVTISEGFARSNIGSPLSPVVSHCLPLSHIVSCCFTLSPDVSRCLPMSPVVLKWRNLVPTGSDPQKDMFLVGAMDFRSLWKSLPNEYLWYPVTHHLPAN